MSGDERILLAHGGGGTLSRRLIEDEFLRAFDNPILRDLDDAAPLGEASPAGTTSPPTATGTSDLTRLAVTTDAYVVSPPFFPGGDIGHLAIAGTVNDLSVSGARPRWITCSFILEEGLPLSDLRRVIGSMAETAREAGVSIVAGDTKVVERGAADRLFVTTTGVGTISGLPAGWGLPEEGDRVLVNGTLGDHGFTILAVREGLEFEHPLRSDTAPLNGLIFGLLEAGVRIRLMRDLTRGGLGGILHELAADRSWGFHIAEGTLPLSPAVRSFSELLGLDPLFVANEGKLVLVVAEQDADKALDLMRDHPYGRQAADIGAVTCQTPGMVVMETPLGSRRLIEPPSGEQLPRIC
ncbi:MAG: hydrogenase expression/formation protein HypE [Thermoleophilia bacterium]